MTATPLRRDRILQVGWQVLAAIAIWLVVIDWPDPVTDYLDASWQSALVHAHEHGRSFGNGIIFSAGPLGFLNSHFLLPDSLNAKFAWEIGGQLILKIAFVAFASALPPIRRFIFIAAAWLLMTWFPDTFFTVLLVLAVIRVLLPEKVSYGP